MACCQPLWAVHTVERHRAWHAIIAQIRQTRLNNVRRDIPSPPLDNTYDRMTLGRACHHRLWAAHTVERRRAWYDISRLWPAHNHDLPDTQVDRDPSRQPAACARGTDSPKRPAGKGQASKQAGDRGSGVSAVTDSFSSYNCFISYGRFSSYSMWGGGRFQPWRGLCRASGT